MSLNHVLETARKLGIPVVITDEAGEAAQVIMPFEDFAAMVGATSPVPSRKPRVVRGGQTSPISIPIRQQVEEDEIRQAMAELTIERVAERIEQAVDNIEEELGTKPKNEGFLEDKFYLEPIDDEESSK